MEILLEFIFSMIATMGFAYSFTAPKQAVVYSGFSGAASWCVYYILIRKTKSLYISTTIASFVVGILGEIFARKFKMPSSCFTIPAILPLSPGTSIYHMISNFIRHNNQLALAKMFDAIIISGSISFGILLSSVWSRSLKRFKISRPERSKLKEKVEKIEGI